MIYVEGVKEIEAQQHLLHLKEQEYPWLKEDKRSKYFKEIQKVAYPRKENKIHNFDDIERIFRL